MPVSVVLPALGESVTEGTVTRWLKKEGESVSADEPLLEVSTDKVDTEIPAPASGVLLAIKVGEDETVAVGTELAVIGDEAEGTTSPASSAPAAQAPEEVTSAEEAPAETPAEQAPETPAEPEAPAPASGGDAQGVSVVLPALGESVTEGTVTRWLKKEGESVSADEPLLEVSTDKVDTEIPAPASGVLLAIKVGEDETVAVGTELAVIGEAGGAQAAAPAAAPKAAAPKPAPAPAPAPTPEPATSKPAPAAPQVTTAPAPESVPSQTTAEVPGAYVTPLVRKLAAEHNVDLGQLSGTGVGGRIRKQDVLEAAKSQPAQPRAEAAPAPARAQAAPAVTPSPLRGRTEPMSRLRKVIAKRMVESLQTSAQLTTVLEADITNLARLRDRAKRDFEAREKVRLSFLPFFAKATVEALKVHPSLNASIDTEAGTITYHDTDHLGVAVETERGLLVPVIHNAGDLNIAGLARKVADLAERTRSNKLSPDELAGGTFTLTNTGSRGALFDTPIINQPQVGILGTGAVVKRPIVIDDPDLGDVVAVRSMVYLALSYDHRLVDGADAARFLTTIKQRLEEARFEADLGL